MRELFRDKHRRTNARRTRSYTIYRDIDQMSQKLFKEREKRKKKRERKSHIIFYKIQNTFLLYNVRYKL